MSKRHSAKYKIDRRMGENIWGRPKYPINARSYGPGQHGQRRKQKISDFGLQLRAKQKLKGYYGNLTEKQFSRTYEEAARRKGNTSENLIALLESRLDAIVYRAKFVPTPFAARQFVNHGHVLVNGKRVNIAVLPREGGRRGRRCARRSRNMALVLEALQLAERDTPDYLEVDAKAMTAKYMRMPGTGRGALSGEDGAATWSSSSTLRRTLAEPPFGPEPAPGYGVGSGRSALTAARSSATVSIRASVSSDWRQALWMATTTCSRGLT